MPGRVDWGLLGCGAAGSRVAIPAALNEVLVSLRTVFSADFLTRG